MLTADMPSGFWAGWIGIITLISVIGLIWMLFSIYFSDKSDDDHMLPTWDGDLREGTRAPPIWWFWMMLALLIISDIYLILYPGLGNFKGALQWSQAGRLHIAQKNYEANFDGVRNLVAAAPLAPLQADVDVMKSAAGIFAQNCAGCHGLDGRGQASRFPDLRDEHWQWGGDPAQIEQSIRAGRIGIMPGWQESLDHDDVTNVVAYIKTLPSDAGSAEHPGQPLYTQICIACHGGDGSGNLSLGAPDITAGAWTYGGTDEALRETIATGRSGNMPPFDKRLDDVQVRMLVAWLTRKD